MLIGGFKKTMMMAMLLLMAYAKVLAQKKQTMRAYFENLNAKAAAGQQLTPVDEGLYMAIESMPLREILDAAPAIREALAHDATVKYGAGMLMGIGLRPDTDAVLRESHEAMEGAITKASAWSRLLCLPYLHVVQFDHIYTGFVALETYLERGEAGSGACFAQVLLTMKPIPPDADTAVAKFIRRKDLNSGDLATMTNVVANSKASSPEVVKATVELIHDARVNQYFVQEMGRQPEAVRDGVRQELVRTLQDEEAKPESRAEAKQQLDQMDGASESRK